jgi:hypothetical protein
LIDYIWSLAQGGGHRLRVFENKVLKKISGLKAEGRNGRLEKMA